MMERQTDVHMQKRRHGDVNSGKPCSYEDEVYIKRYGNLKVERACCAHHSKTLIKVLIFVQ